jgi:uncharacterized linocin/CFP29 family protein
MTDLLRRDLAPVTTEAWKEIDEEATRTLRTHLTARRILDINGPHGWSLGAINLGTLDMGKEEPVPGVGWGLRKNLPLMEIRVPFTLDTFDLDTVSRGSSTPDLDAVSEAARKAALFEESAIYKGFAAAGITGILDASSQEPVSLSGKPERLIKAIEKGVHALQQEGIGGPYELVLGDDPHQRLYAGEETCYPLHRRAAEILCGGIHWSRALEGGVILSSRGGDFEFSCGQDLSIGYATVEEQNVHLYITESFTFRVLEPGAAVPLTV